MNSPLIDAFIIDDDNDFREVLEALFTMKDLTFRSFSNAEDALRALVPGQVGCVVSDVKMPGMDGVTLTRELRAKDPALPIILITAFGDVSLAVKAVKYGANEFLEKPFDNDVLHSLVLESLAVTESDRDKRLREVGIQKNLKDLTARERDILKLLAVGLSNKEVALKLDISYRTVEVHRAHIMEKLNAKSVVDFVHAAEYM